MWREPPGDSCLERRLASRVLPPQQGDVWAWKEGGRGVDSAALTETPTCTVPSSGGVSGDLLSVFAAQPRLREGRGQRA